LCSGEYVDECINAWSDTLYLLKEEHGGLFWPRVSTVRQQTVNKKSPEMTVQESATANWSTYNFLEAAALKKESKNVLARLPDRWKTEARQVRNKLGLNMNCEKWRETPTEGQNKTMSKMQKLFPEKSLIDIKTQKAVYWLAVGQIIPPIHKFRTKIQVEYGIDWLLIDKLKIYTQSCRESFMWRGIHGKLYAKRDLSRFGFTQEAECIYCDEESQTISHLYLECRRIKKLFKNFELHYKLEVPLTLCEKLIGVDTNMQRSKVTTKRLSSLRKLIYSCNHEGRIPRWDDALSDVDRQYITEYGIAEKSVRVDRVLQDWNL
jgi:hypothetical protein